jgi:hypothetical protein
MTDKSKTSWTRLVTAACLLVTGLLAVPLTPAAPAAANTVQTNDDWWDEDTQTDYESDYPDEYTQTDYEYDWQTDDYEPADTQTDWPNYSTDDWLPTSEDDSYNLSSNHRTKSANTGVKYLKPGKAYKTILQGSKQHVVSWGAYIDTVTGTLYLCTYVDGRKGVLKMKNFRGGIADDWTTRIVVALAHVNSNTTLLYIELHDTSGSAVRAFLLYRYDNAKRSFVLVDNLLKRNPFKGRVGYTSAKRGTLVKAKKGRLHFKWYNPWSQSTGYIFYEAIFRYSNNKVKSVPYAKLLYPSPKKKLTARMAFTCYQQPGSKKVAFTVHKGNKASMLQIKKYKQNQYYIQIKYNNKKGWVTAGSPNNLNWEKQLLFAGTNGAE